MNGKDKTTHRPDDIGAHRPICRGALPKGRRRSGRRSAQEAWGKRGACIALEAVSLAAVPAVLAACAVSGVEQTALLSMLVVLAALLLFFAAFEGGSPRMRDIMPTVVLAALAAAGRILFAPFPDFKPVSAIAIIAGVAFGRRSGFMVGALAALASNFFFGQGPWTPWQMYAWGLVGYLAGLIAQAGVFEGARHEPRPEGEGEGGRAITGADDLRAAPARPSLHIRRMLRALPLYAYGFVSGPLYGVVLNLWSIVGFYHPQTAAQFIAVYAAAVPFDMMHGVATVVFLLALYAPWRRKLERVKRKYGI